MIPRVPVFVCGEPARGDDAAGFAAVDLLPGELRDRVEGVPGGQLDILFLLDLPADAPCVVPGPKGNREHFVYAVLKAGVGSED